MPARKPVATKALIDATVDSVKGMSVAKVRAKHDISERAARHVAKAANLSKEEFMSGVQSNLKAALSIGAERLAHEMERISTAQLPVSVGILVDKNQGLDANRMEQPKTQINIQINGESKSKDDVLKGLFGNAVDMPGPEIHEAKS